MVRIERTEIRRRDADDIEPFALDTDPLADDVRVARVMAHPERMPKHGDVSRLRQAFVDVLVCQKPAGDWTHTDGG